MKFVAWNLAHQIRVKPIPDYLAEVVRDLDADTVLFNEYVDDETREPFKAAMRDAGYNHQAVSPSPPRQNQIYAASRHRFATGDLKPPQFGGSAGSAISNFLHIRFIDFNFEAVGFRAPAYKLAADRNAYWAELAAIMESVKERPILFAGDANYDPFRNGKMPGTKSVPFHRCAGYQIPNPQGNWSFLGHTGRNSRIDHVIHTSEVKINSVEYIDWIRGRPLAGVKAARPISDHAALRFEVITV